MSTPADHLSELRDQIAYKIKSFTELVQNREEYAKRYAYDATIRFATCPEERYRESECHSLNLAFWHDGHGKAIAESVMELIHLQKLLNTYEESLKPIHPVQSST